MRTLSFTHIHSLFMQKPLGIYALHVKMGKITRMMGFGTARVSGCIKSAIMSAFMKVRSFVS